MSKFPLNKYVAIKKYNCYSRTIKEIWKHLGREKTWRGRRAMTAALKYFILKAGVRLEVTFSSENEAKNPEIAGEYLGQI